MNLNLGREDVNDPKEKNPMSKPTKKATLSSTIQKVTTSKGEITIRFCADCREYVDDEGYCSNPFCPEEML